MTNKKLTIISVSLLSLFLIATFATLRQQAQDTSQPQQKEANKSDEDFPIVSLDTSNQAKRINEERKKKNEKFDKSQLVKQTVYQEATDVKRIRHWQIGLPALPVQKSDAVAVGVIQSSEAFLSNDQTGVYSEFSVLIETIVKNNETKPIEPRTSITAQRIGGRVHYPSGKVVKYSISGQEMPRLNGKYILFLSYDQQTNAYRIITAYEIANGKIIALDGKGRDKSSGFVFSQYDGVEEQQFMNELQNALYLKTNPSKEITTP